MTKVKSIVACFLATVLTLGSVACTPPTVSTLVTTLSAVSDAASVAVVVAGTLTATGTLSPEEAGLVSTYATAVSTATTKSITELNSTDTNVVKVTVITEAFAVVAAPAFGPNVSPQIIAVTNAIGTAVQLFLNQLHASGALKMARLAPHAVIKLEKGDKAKLKAIMVKATETSAKAKLLKK
jgi:hypothetical protein